MEIMKDCILNNKNIMVGDWVIRTDVKDPHPVQVARIEIDNNYNIWVKDDPENLGINFKYVELNNCQPIPITPELLLKNGFDIDSVIRINSHYNHFSGVDNRVTLHDSQEFMNTYNDWSVHIDNNDYETIATCELTYLHELQHQLKFNEIEFEWKI